MKTVFKAQQGKLPFSRNTTHACVFCLAVKGPGEVPFSVCGRCKAVRYCNREHQVAHWPVHKAFCKLQSSMLQSLESGATGELQSFKERQYLLEDFEELHHYTIQQFMASAIDAANHSLKQFAFISLSYCPESAGNPSTSFKLLSAQLVDNPVPNTSLGAGFAAFRPLADEGDNEFRGEPGYQGTLLCYYVINNQPSWLTGLRMFDYDLCRRVSTHDEWFIPLKYLVDKGLVFRFCKEGMRPGMMKRQGTTWVWMQKSVEELREYDIYIQRGDSSIVGTRR